MSKQENSIILTFARRLLMKQVKKSLVFVTVVSLVLAIASLALANTTAPQIKKAIAIDNSQLMAPQISGDGCHDCADAAQAVWDDVYNTCMTIRPFDFFGCAADADPYYSSYIRMNCPLCMTSARQQVGTRSVWLAENLYFLNKRQPYKVPLARRAARRRG